MSSYADHAFKVGFFGDIALQAVNKLEGGNFAGFGPYFAHHGPVASVFIAGGMLYAFGLVYEKSGAPMTIPCTAAYGAALDLAFRYGRFMPSLDEYYATEPVLVTAFWGAVPMSLPLILFKK